MDVQQEVQKTAGFLSFHQILGGEMYGLFFLINQDGHHPKHQECVM